MLLTNLMKAIGVRRRPSAEDLISKGTAFLNAGAWQDAAACFEAALQAAPHDFTLTAVGLGNVVARTEEEYLEINVRLASDMQGLSRLRSSLRQRTQDSPLMDEEGFTLALEDIYRDIWREWCVNGTVAPKIPGSPD